MPRVEAAEHKIGQDKSTILPATGGIDIDPPDIEIVEGQAIGSFTEELQFMEEFVGCLVHESADPNAERIVEVWNGGTPQRFIRGNEQTVRRKYIEVLARAKHTNINTPEITDSDGNRTTRIDRNTSLKYPFSITRDTAKGAAWLRKILAEA